MEQSLSKDIRKLYTKSIMWTVIMTIITMIVFILLLAFLQRGLIPANQSEKIAIDAMSEMKENTTRYLNEQIFSQKQKALQKEDVFLSEYSTDGKMISGSRNFESLFKGKSIPNILNTNITDGGYFHQVVPINEHDDIAGVWVYSYKLKADFINEYYRYFIVGVIFLLFLTPIIYFIVFSRHYINKLYQSIKHPLDELMKASHKVSQKDLEFHLKYHSKNEIGQLTQSFRQMQEELKKSLYENWRKDSEWAVMMSSLSHDLKTPATLIALSAEMLHEVDALTTNQQSHVDIINRNILKVNNILKSMGQANRVKDPTKVNPMMTIGELIESVENDFIPLMKKNHIQYEHNLDVNTNLEVPYLKLNRILENIFTNAVQYTPENGEIRFFMEESDGQIHFALEDSGIGIRQENRDVVFSKHFREDPSRSSSLGNAGLGLFNAKSLVTTLDGRIETVDPLVLTGTRIEFYIPV